MRRYKEDSKVNRLRKVLAVMAVGLAAGLILFSTVTGNNKKAGVSVYAGNAVDKMGLSEVRIEFIPGYDNPEGESSFQIIIGAEGEGFAKIPYGEYTVRWKKNGYYDGYLNIEVKEKEFKIEKWMLPCAEGDSAYILAEWNGEGDLDLCVYDEQNGRCIGVVPTLKDAGNCLYSDENGGNGYDSAYIKDVLAGSYTIYVRDSDNIAENHDSSMEQNGVTVSIYTENGLQYQKTAEAEETAGLWKCALLYNGEVTEQDEYLYDLTGYAWAERNKHNPDSWAKESDIKVEEVYHYASYGIDKIERIEYDNKDCAIEKNHCVENLTYNADGQISDGFQEEWAYDEHGNWLIYSRRKYEGGVMTSTTKYQYDKYGNCILKCSYDQNEMLTDRYRQENRYDTNGNLIFCSYYNDLNEQSELLWEEEWEYNEADKVTAHRFKREGLLEYEYIYEWDAAGKLLWDCKYSYDEGELEGQEESEYDMAGNEVQYYLYDGRGELISWEEYEYDARGNKTVSYRYSKSGSLIEILEMEYDEADRPTILSIHNPGDCLEKREWKYDAEGMIISLVTRGDYDYDGVYECRYEWFYDTNGNNTSWFDYEGEILIRGGRYEYDERGNEKAFYSYTDGSWIQEYAYTYEYAYDAVAGMLITDRYEGDFLNKRTVTIYGDI